MSIPASRIASTTTGFTRSAGCVPAETARAFDGSARRVEERRRHLRSPRVVHAGEDDRDHGLQQSVPQQGWGAGLVARTNALANRPSAMS